MDMFEALDRHSRGLPYDKSKYLRARDAGLLGGDPDPEYEAASRMDEHDSLDIRVSTYHLDVLSRKTALSEKLQIAKVDTDQLLNLLHKLQAKELAGIGITPLDIDELDLKAADLVEHVYEEQVEELRAHDPKFVEAMSRWIEKDSKAALEKADIRIEKADKATLLVAKIDAADRMIVELHEELKDKDRDYRKEVRIQLQIALSERDQLAAELTAEELERYYALAA